MTQIPVHFARLRAASSLPSADHAPAARRHLVTAGRATAPSGAPAQLHRAGGEGIRLRCARSALTTSSSALLWYSPRPAGLFFTCLLRHPFFVASVVAPPESLILETAPQRARVRRGH